LVRPFLAFFLISWQDVAFMAIFWLMLVLSIAACGIASTFMKMEVNGRLPPAERFSWWNRDAGKVTRKYREFYPDSYLPVIAQFSFWLFVILFVVWAILSSTGKLD